MNKKSTPLWALIGGALLIFWGLSSLAPIVMFSDVGFSLLLYAFLQGVLYILAGISIILEKPFSRKIGIIIVVGLFVVGRIFRYQQKRETQKFLAKSEKVIAEAKKQMEETERWNKELEQQAINNK